MTIKDAADLFAAQGEGTGEVLDAPKAEARDALDLALSEAPDGSQRERYRYAKEEVLPLLLSLEDKGERGAALDDVANRLKLGKRNLRKALEEAIKSARQAPAEPAEHQEEGAGESPPPKPDTERHERAMALLRSPDILDAAVRDMERLGHVGEPTAKKLLFVCAVSASAGLAIQPSIHAESSSGKNFLADTVLSLLPLEKVIKRSAISAKALYRTQESLAGRVLYLQEHSGSEAADFTFRVMQSDGRLIYEATEQGPDGGFRTVVHEKEGPLVIVQTTTELRLFDENATRVFAFYLDESSEQTERVVRSALTRAANGGIPKDEREAILERWHDAIRLLESAEVIVPFAERIAAPSRLVRMRRDINRLLDVIRVLAWLHQHARERDGLGRVLAAEEDFHAALALVDDSLRRAWGSMSPAEEAVMGAIRSLPEAVRRNGFKRAELPLGELDPRRVQEVLKSLTEAGHIECEKGGGPGGYRYTVPRDPGGSVLGISLSPEGDEGDDGDDPEDPDAEEDPEPVRGMDREGEARVPRGSARTEDPAIDGPLSPEEVPIARSREGEGGFVFGDDESDGDEPGEEAVDHIAELTSLGWYRAETSFPTTEGAGDVEEGPMARRLRREVAIFKWKNWWSEAVVNPGPLAFTAKDLHEGLSADDRAAGPSEPGITTERLHHAVSWLQAAERGFWDPGLDDWYAWSGRYPDDPEKLRKDAYLHAELWSNEATGEQIWALVALREGWYVPERDIEGAVWRRATSGRSPFVGPELLPHTSPDFVDPPLDGAS